jgi:ketosteroid isomerase-like protein
VLLLTFYYFKTINHLVKLEKNTSTKHERKQEDIRSQVKRTETKEETNIRVVRRALEALNTGDVSRVHEFLSPEYFNHESQVDPVRSQLRGPDEFIDTVKNLRGAFANLHYEEQETIASGDKVISILNVTGKHVGNFLSLFLQLETISLIEQYIYIELVMMEK